jgi:hypothetical protein
MGKGSVDGRTVRDTKGSISWAGAMAVGSFTGRMAESWMGYGIKTRLCLACSKTHMGICNKSQQSKYQLLDLYYRILKFKAVKNVRGGDPPGPTDKGIPFFNSVKVVLRSALGSKARHEQPIQNR